MPTVEFNLGGTLRFVVAAEESRAGAYFTIRYRDFVLTAKGNGMAYKLAAGNQVTVKVSYVDANGNPATVDGDVRWDSSDSSIVEVDVDAADSAQALVQATGKTGQVQVTATADADLGGGVREIITPMDVEVVAGEAVSGTIEPVGAAVPIPT